MAQLKSLDAIGLSHGTDKSSVHHNYLEFYEIFFAPLRHKKISILEVGVFGGASIRTWKEYFPSATIIGADIDPYTKRFKADRIIIELLDQSNIEQLTRVAVKHGPFDIIIEDGSHMWEHQTTSLRTLFPFVKSGGIYIVEDLQTNYGSYEEHYKGIATKSCMEYLKSLVDLRVADTDLPIEAVEDAFLRTYGRKMDFITFYRRACLIKKQAEREVVASQPGHPIVPLNSASLPLSVHAHISYKGDVEGNAGFVDFGEDKFPIQGFWIEDDQSVIQYRALRHGHSTWGAWCDNNGFVGTRGQSQMLAGFAVRLKEGSKDHYNLRVIGRFAGSLDPITVADGEDCVSAAGAALCGIQIELTKRVR